ncbi:MAG: amino acid synthesis family protein [Betaproteobacteria bacterium]|nr:amino acid synthesis family protein [Betaproteobacteria bacterium]
MKPAIRKMAVLTEELMMEAGRKSSKPLRRVAVIVAIRNPLVGRFSRSLKSLIEMGGPLGVFMAGRLLEEFGRDAGVTDSYGKAVIVGQLGEIEHGHAIVTRPFGSSVRGALSATAWMCSNVKRGVMGAKVDVPLAYKNALAVRSHYDTMEVSLSDAPFEDELVVILAATNGGRLHARTGGLRKQDVMGHDVYVDKAK